MEEFDVDDVASRLGMSKPQASLWLMWLSRNGYLTRRRAPERLCRYEGGYCNRGKKFIYSFSRNGRKYMEWRKSCVEFSDAACRCQ